MRKAHSLLQLVLAVVLVANGSGCLADPGMPTVERSHGSLQGPQVGVLKKNSSRLNGPYLSGLRLRSSQFVTGTPRLPKPLVVASGLLQTTSREGPLQSLDSGASFHTLEGATFQFRIDSITEDGQYVLTMTDGVGTHLACEDPAAVVVVPGWWDEDTGDVVRDAPSDAFTLACTDAAIGKCELLGYSMWNGPGTEYHTACTRMIRADYCGNGQSHTIDGTPIDLWDDLKINAAEVGNFMFEAEWDSQGAVCLSRTRLETLSQDAVATLRSECPEILPGPNDSGPDGCGAVFDDETPSILMNSSGLHP